MRRWWQMTASSTVPSSGAIILPFIWRRIIEASLVALTKPIHTGPPPPECGHYGSSLSRKRSRCYVDVIAVWVLLQSRKLTTLQWLVIADMIVTESASMLVLQTYFETNKRKKEVAQNSWYVLFRLKAALSECLRSSKRHGKVLQNVTFIFLKRWISSLGHHLASSMQYMWGSLWHIKMSEVMLMSGDHHTTPCCSLM